MSQVVTRSTLIRSNHADMVPFGLIAIGAFWVAAIKLWVVDGPRIPLICIAIWLIAFFGIPILRWPGVVFLIIECILAIILLLIDRYKSGLN